MRRGRRVGRPPAVPTVPFGSCKILSFEPSAQRPGLVTPTIPTTCTSPTIDTIGAESNGDNETSQSIARNDSNWPIHKDPTDGASYFDCAADSPPERLCTLIGALHDCPLQISRHHHLQCILSDHGMFYNYHRHFMIGPSFCDGFRNAIVSVFPRGGGVLLDAYLAALALWDSEHHRVKAPGEMELIEGSHCLKQLQNTAIQEPLDAAAVIMLGQILAVYHIVAFGTSANAIVRRSLLSVKEWYPSLLIQPHLNPITITPILVDTVESLVRREVPVIRFPRVDSATVDRSFGLCVNLLHIHYEICKLSHSAKIAASRGLNSSDLLVRPCPAIVEKLTMLEKQSREWEPSPPASFFIQYSQLEVWTMLLQARVYRLATLLIIHRLQYPLGVEDETASRLAMTIATELDFFAQHFPDEMERLAVGLPLLVSALETGHLSDHVIACISPATSEPGYSEKLKNFVNLVRAARDNGFRGLWFDLVEGGLHIPVLP